MDCRVGVVAPWAGKDGTDAQFEVRAFSGRNGGHEDPVTGSLNAGLAQWLIDSGKAPSTYTASQGSAVGRKGRVQIEQDGTQIWVGGATETIIAGSLTL